MYIEIDVETNTFQYKTNRPGCGISWYQAETSMVFFHFCEQSKVYITHFIHIPVTVAVGWFEIPCSSLTPTCCILKEFGLVYVCLLVKVQCLRYFYASLPLLCSIDILRVCTKIHSSYGDHPTCMCISVSVHGVYPDNT